MIQSIKQASNNCINAIKSHPLEATAIAIGSILSTYGLYSWSPSSLLLAVGASAITLATRNVICKMFNTPFDPSTLDELIRDCEEGFNAVGKKIESILPSRQTTITPPKKTDNNPFNSPETDNPFDSIEHNPFDSKNTFNPEKELKRHASTVSPQTPLSTPTEVSIFGLNLSDLTNNNPFDFPKTDNPFDFSDQHNPFESETLIQTGQQVICVDDPFVSPSSEDPFDSTTYYFNPKPLTDEELQAAIDKHGITLC
jgi:hypothetical protein